MHIAHGTNRSLSPINDGTFGLVAYARGELEKGSATFGEFAVDFPSTPEIALDRMDLEGCDIAWLARRESAHSNTAEYGLTFFVNAMEDDGTLVVADILGITRAPISSYVTSWIFRAAFSGFKPSRYSTLKRDLDMISAHLPDEDIVDFASLALKAH